jgi:creatinine amidohydrolase
MKRSTKKQRTFSFAHSRPSEVLRARKKPGILWLPIGPLEWHGPHMPYGVDPLNAQGVAYACAEKLGGLVLPTLYCGTERERAPEMLKSLGLNPNSYVVGMDFPKNPLVSGYFPEEEFVIQVMGWVERAIEWNFPTLVIINGHGAQNHNEALYRIVQAFRPKNTPIDVLAFLGLVKDAQGNLNIGHASHDETSIMMMDYPEDIAMHFLPPKSRPLKSADFSIVDDLTFRCQPTPDFSLRKDDDPRFLSNAAYGKKARAVTVAYVTQQIRRFLKDRSAPRCNLNNGSPYRK